MFNEIQRIVSKIFTLPNRPPFMLDRDVAELYETEKKYVNRAVERNPERFPEDFCFQLTQEEVGKLVTNWHRFKPLKHSIVLPHGFAREGCNILSAVLNTPVAIDRSVFIMRAFTAMERGIFRFKGDAPDSPMLPNGWQMYELRSNLLLNLSQYLNLVVDKYFHFHRNKVDEQIADYSNLFDKPVRFFKADFVKEIERGR